MSVVSIEKYKWRIVVRESGVVMNIFQFTDNGILAFDSEEEFEDWEYNAGR